eukprot:TRINITY_DN244_c0_g1_i3.p1 TRINITY_DN244_c0_g1~~TRINITY_DN244_c0_g1_i3.p1  ORF type:complete len:839 (-),score=212.25 TRINITY_DN244_c0_g1_i3:302-2500(-)
MSKPLEIVVQGLEDIRVELEPDNTPYQKVILPISAQSIDDPSDINVKFMTTDQKEFIGSVSTIDDYYVIATFTPKDVGDYTCHVSSSDGSAICNPFKYSITDELKSVTQLDSENLISLSYMRDIKGRLITSYNVLHLSVRVKGPYGISEKSEIVSRGYQSVFIQLSPSNPGLYRAMLYYKGKALLSSPLLIPILKGKLIQQLIDDKITPIEIDSTTTTTTTTTTTNATESTTPTTQIKLSPIYNHTGVRVPYESTHFRVNFNVTPEKNPSSPSFTVNEDGTIDVYFVNKAPGRYEIQILLWERPLLSHRFTFLIKEGSQSTVSRERRVSTGAMIPPIVALNTSTGGFRSRLSPRLSSSALDPKAAYKNEVVCSEYISKIRSLGTEIIVNVKSLREPDHNAPGIDNIQTFKAEVISKVQAISALKKLDWNIFLTQSPNSLGPTNHIIHQLYQTFTEHIQTYNALVSTVASSISLLKSATVRNEITEKFVAYAKIMTNLIKTYNSTLQSSLSGSQAAHAQALIDDSNSINPLLKDILIILKNYNPSEDVDGGEEDTSSKEDNQDQEENQEDSFSYINLLSPDYEFPEDQDVQLKELIAFVETDFQSKIDPKYHAIICSPYPVPSSLTEAVPTFSNLFKPIIPELKSPNKELQFEVLIPHVAHVTSFLNQVILRTIIPEHYMDSFSELVEKFCQTLLELIEAKMNDTSTDVLYNNLKSYILDIKQVLTNLEKQGI